MDDRVSVVVVTRDRRDELARTLRNLARLPERPPVIVVDNASGDGTSAMVRSSFPGVTLLRARRNLGARARTAGAARARTPYVAFSDDDSWWANGALSRAADVLDAHPSVALVAARVVVEPGGTPDPATDVLAAGPLGTRPGLPGPTVLGFLACASVGRRDALLAAPPFPARLGVGAEEQMLAWDLTARGHDVIHVPGLTAHHQPSPVRDVTRRQANLRRNDTLVRTMRLPVRDVVRAWRDLGRAAVREGPRARRAAAEALAMLPYALVRRRRLPDHVLCDIDLVAARPALPAPLAPGERFAVVIITRNRRVSLLRTLAHLAALPRVPPVHVVDNASSDGTADAVRAAHPWVRVTRLEHNLGAPGRNPAVRAAGTPYVAFWDDDLWWEPGAMERAADILDADPRVAAVTGRIVVEPGGDEDPIVPELRGSPVPGPPDLPGPALGSLLAGASMVRADAFLAAGGFDPLLHLGGEEELLAADLLAAGRHLVYADDVVVHHHVSPLRDPTARRRAGIRNTLWFTWLRRPAGRALARTARVLAHVPRDATSALAVADAVRALPTVLRRRRVLPGHAEHRLRTLDRRQFGGRARRYVG